MSNSEVLIKAENVSKKFCRSLKKGLWYGMKDIGAELVGRNRQPELRPEEFWAVSDVSFELRRGECIGLIGRNGAGKSTLLKILNGLIKPDKGRITMRGRVGALIELGAGFNPILTGRENLYVNAAVLGISRKEIDKKIDSIIEFSEIGDFIETPVQYYSSGMRVRLGFGVAAHLEPDVLLIDEVLAVGDLGFRIKCLNSIANLMKNSAVIFVSHAMPMVSFVCTRIMMLNNGQVEYQGNDVGAGIDNYLSVFALSDETIAGSGKAVISDVRISNGQQTSSGKETLSLNYGDDLFVEMNLTLNCFSKQLAIMIWLETQDLRSVADCFSQFCGFDILPRTRSRIRLQLKNLWLNMGIYSVGIGVVDTSTKELWARNSFAAKIQVNSSYTSWSSFLLPGEWSQE